MVSALESSSVSLLSPNKFIDYRGLEWGRVRRARYFCHQCFHYDYPGPIRDLRHRLIVVPADAYNDQRLLGYHLEVTPHAVATRAFIDSFGNRVIDIELPYAERGVTFDVTTITERLTSTANTSIVHAVPVDSFLTESKLVGIDESVLALARELHSTTREDGEALIDRISDYIHSMMCYCGKSTTVKTTAAEALALRRGLCQDYAHLMIALCRALNIPARYVSGHMLGEGGSHAWVEVLLPSASKRRASDVIAIDPTNRRRADLRYITIATGRDYADVSPTYGTFTAPYGGRLTSSKRAGLTMVEYIDGEVIEEHSEQVS